MFNLVFWIRVYVLLVVYEGLRNVLEVVVII